MAVSSIVPNPNPPQRGRQVVFTINHDTDAPSFSLDDITFSIFAPGQITFPDDDLTLVRINNRTYTLAVDLPDTTNFILIQIFGVNHPFTNVEDPPPAPIPTITFEGADGNAITSGFAGQLVTAVISWSQAFTGTFGTGQVTVSGGSKSSFSGRGTNYRQSINLPSRSDGTLSVSIAADIVANSDGTNNLAGQASLPYSRPTPTVTFRNATGLAGVDTVADVTFPAPVSGIDTSSDFRVTNGTFISIATRTVGRAYAVTVRPDSGKDATLTLAVLENRATHGNLAASDTLSFTRQSLVLNFDDQTLVPGVQTSLTLTSNSPITGLFGTEVVVTGGQLDSFVVTNNTAQILVTPTRLQDGTLSISIAENALSRGNRAVSVSRTYARPVVTISLNETDTGNSMEVVATISWNIAPSRSDFDGNDVTLSAGIKGAFSGSGREFRQVFTTPAAGGGTAVLAVRANAIHEGNAAASASVAYTPIPVPTITFSESDPISGRALNAVVAISRDITNLVAADFTVTGGTRGSLIRVNARRWLLGVTPDYRTDGTLRVDLAANVVPEGNLSATASIDYLRPRFTIAFDVARLHLGVSTDVRIQCNVPTTFFHTEDVSVAGGTKGDFTAVDDSNYTVGITSPATGSGAIVVSIPENAIPEGNPAVEARITYADIIRTSIAFDVAQAIHSTVLHAIITFTAPVTAVRAGLISVTNGSKGTVTGSGTEWRLPITPPASGSGNIVVSIALDVVPEGNTAATASILYAGSDRAPEIVPVGRQRILLDTDYRLPITVRYVPDWVRVDGLYERFHYDRQAGLVYIVGHPTREIADEVWDVRAGNVHGEDQVDVIWDVVPPVPVISDVARLTIRRGTGFSVDIAIANAPSSVTVDGLLTGLGFEKTDTGIRIYGTVSATADFTVTDGTLSIVAKNTGGTDTADVPFDLVA